MAREATRRRLVPAGVDNEVLSLYEEQAPGLHHYAMASTANPDLSQDAVQEAFFQYFLLRAAGEPVPRRRTFLFRTLREYLRARIAERTHAEQGDRVAPGPDWRQHPELAVQSSELNQQILRLLSPRELECIRLREEGLKYEDIAAVLRIRSGTVGALLTRAVRELRGAMGPMERPR